MATPQKEYADIRHPDARTPRLIFNQGTGIVKGHARKYRRLHTNAPSCTGGCEAAGSRFYALLTVMPGFTWQDSFFIICLCPIRHERRKGIRMNKANAHHAKIRYRYKMDEDARLQTAHGLWGCIKPLGQK